MRIPRRDIVDEDGTAQDYFLLIFTGFGKESRSFLISANELVHNFQCSGVDGSDSYYVPAQLFASFSLEGIIENPLLGQRHTKHLSRFR